LARMASSKERLHAKGAVWKEYLFAIFPENRRYIIFITLIPETPRPRVKLLPGPDLSSYLGLHKTLDLRVSIALLANAVASGSPSMTRPTRSGDNQARWIRLLT
jgi:hypothetical protein